MDIGAWLRDLGLERYAPAFIDNDVDPAVLPELTAEDLVGLGVLSIGHRRKLLAAAARLGGVEPVPRAAPRGTRPAPARRPLPGAPPGEAERRQLTVAFVDLVGSTALGRGLDPEELAGLIRAYQDAVSGEVARFGGHVAKLMGDGLLCFFGWPRAREDAAERAVRAGLAAVEAVGRLRAPGGGGRLAARVGVATGLVVVGELVGDGPAREHAVVGETPNLAARLQAAARPGEVLVAAATRDLLGDHVVLDDRGGLEVKGYEAAVRAYAVLGAGERGGNRFGAPRGAAAPAPLVGRGRELASLLDAWDRAARGAGGVVRLLGEPGIGKSRLAEALRSRLAAAPHAFLGWQCSPLHAGSPLHPFADELGRAAGFGPGDGDGARRGKLRALLAGRLDDPAPAFPVLADLLGLPGGGGGGGDGRPPRPELTPQQLKAKTLAALAAQVEGLAARGPVLLVFEDAHWADPTSLQLLAALAEAAARLPVLLLVTHRPEFAPDWAGLQQVATLALDRLGRKDAAALAGMAAGSRLPPAALDRVVDRADGVPLFVEHLVEAMLEAGIPEGAEAERQGLRPPGVPGTLHDLLAARLDRLGPAKRILQVGAAIGREFPHALAALVSRTGDRALGEGLARAAESGLVVCEGAGPAATCRFRHALVQEAAYGSMLKSRRRALHASIARAAEAHAPGLRDARPEWLARHYIEAGQAARAAPLWLEAGRRAKAAFATAEATGHLRSCLAATSAAEGGAAGPRPRLRRVRAEALALLGDLAALSEDLAGADELYGRAIDEAPGADLRRRVANRRHRRRTAWRDGAPIAFHEHGAGDTTLLFVSTQAVGVAMFRPVLERLCDEFRIVTVDPRGSGASAPLARPYTTDDHAADARAVIAALDAPRLVGVGLSMGANVLFRVAHASPGLLRGIVAIGAPVAGHRRPFFPEDWLRAQEELRRTGEVETMLRLHVARVFSEPEMREMLGAIERSRLALPCDTLVSFFLDGSEDDVTGILPGITTPTLVAHGREDRLVSFAAAELAVSLLPDAALRAFEGKGHLPIFTATGQFCDALRGFVRGLSQPRPNLPERAA